MKLKFLLKKRLEKYLKDLKIYSGDEGIFEDVEIRITEILAELGVKENGVITEKKFRKLKLKLVRQKYFKI